ncbi:MAG: tRNA epoxyqueuosine(34) reductase QueG [bacterium]
MSLTQAIKDRAADLGFELVGIAAVEPVPELSFYKEWIEAGYAGEMAYLQRNADQRADITQVVPEAKSVIVCAKIYHTPYPLSTERTETTAGWISRYGWGDDYHDVLRHKLFEFVEFIKRASAQQVVSRVYVDTGPVVDRVYAKYAGIGWFGKNTCLINQTHGSWFFLGEIITNLELEADTPPADRCGTCTRCLEACPTGALVAPYVLDSRLCISYLTIELREEIPPELRDPMGNHVFGCDICQDVCPWNRKANPVTDAEFLPREGLFNPDLMALATLSQEEFTEKFRRSPVKRSKYKGFLRNVAVAMGNSGEARFLSILSTLAQSDEPMVAEHAQWARDKLQGQQEDKQS